MRAIWEDYDGALERLKKDSQDKLNGCIGTGLTYRVLLAHDAMITFLSG